MLKLPIYILSFYLLLLSLVPCCAWDECPDEKQAGIVELPDHQSGDDDDCGTCSPFFNCAGCATVISLPVAMHVTLVKQAGPDSEYADFRSPAPCAIYYDVWQPPRL